MMEQRLRAISVHRTFGGISPGRFFLIEILKFQPSVRALRKNEEYALTEES